MRKLSLQIIMLLAAGHLFAQKIILTFHPTDAVESIDKIEATNLETGKRITVTGTDTIYLSSISNAVKTLEDLSVSGTVFPNPFRGQTVLSYYSPIANDIELILSDPTGHVLSNIRQHIRSGMSQFKITGNTSGLYTINVIANSRITPYKTINLQNSGGPASISFCGYYGGGIKEKSLVMEAGELIYFKIFSGDYATVITDRPTESKTYEVQFINCKDKDGKNYAVVQIGQQWWMAENLAYLPEVELPTSESLDPCYYVYNYYRTTTPEAKQSSNYKTYGVLYNWNAAAEACPSGWHLSTDGDWKQMETYIGMSREDVDKANFRGTDQGNKIKTTTGWLFEGNGTNETGFSALPGGYRRLNGTFFVPGSVGKWWCAADSSGSSAWSRSLSYSNGGVYRDINYQSPDIYYGLSVRCVKD